MEQSGLDILLTILKFLGILLSLVFGVLGLLVKFKDDDGIVTKNGRLALILILASSLVAAGATGVETYRDFAKKKEEQDSKLREVLEATQRTEKLLDEIRRATQPITELTVGLFTRISGDEPGLARYMAHLRDEVFKGPRQDIYFKIQDHRVVDPRAPSDPLASRLLQLPGGKLQFFRRPIDLSTHDWVSGGERLTPDFSVNAFLPFSATAKTMFQYEARINYFLMWEYDHATDPKKWLGTGEIASIFDLRGSQLLFFPSGCGQDDLSLEVALGRQRLVLEALVLDFGKGQSFLLRQNHVRQHVGRNGCPFYEFLFPKKYEDFRPFLMINSNIGRMAR